MIVSSEKKFIFVAVPKTGTSSIEKVLGEYGDEELEKGKVKHVPLRFTGDLLEKPYYKFCFFRNPWGRMVSLYHYHVRQGDNFLSRDYKDVPFNKWLRKALLGGMLERQTDYITHRGALIPDVAIYKFEELDDSWKHICKTLDIEWSPLPHINKSKHDHYSKYYAPETIHAVETHCRLEIKMMGYQFEEA